MHRTEGGRALSHFCLASAGLLLVSLAAVAAEPALPAGCPTSDPIEALACLERKLASGASISPRQGVAAAMARYNLRLAEESSEAARQALDEAFRINAQVSDPAEQGENYVELLSTFDLDPAGQEGEVEAPRLDGRAEEVAKASAARLDALPAGPGDDSLLALVHRISRASDAGGVGLAQLAEVFIPAVREVSTELGTAGTDTDKLVRLARRVSLLLLAERAFLQVYATQPLRAVAARTERVTPEDVLAPHLGACRQIFTHLSERGRTNLLAINHRVASQLQQRDPEGAASLDALTLMLLRSLPDGVLAVRDEMQAETGLLLIDLSIDLGRTEEARKTLEETTDAIARIPAWSPQRRIQEILLARARERLGTPFAGHARGIQAVAAAPDGDLVVTVGQDSTVRLWTSEGKVLAPPRRAHSGIVYAVAVSPAGDRFASGGEDRSIRLWNRDGSPIGEPLRAANTVFGLAFSPRGGLLAAGIGGGAVEIRALEGAEPPKSLAGHEGNVYAVAFSPEGDLLASGGQEGTVRLWKPNGSPAAEPLRGHVAAVFSVAFSPQGDLIASAGKDGSIRLWDRTGTPEGAPLWGHVGAVLSVVFSPSSDTLASAGVDGTIRLWSVRERRQIDAVRGHGDSAWCVAFPARRETLLSAGEDSAVRLWRVSDGTRAGLHAADGRSDSEWSGTVSGYFLGDKGKDLLEPLRRFDAALRSPQSSPWSPVQEIAASLARYHVLRAAGDIPGVKKARDMAMSALARLTEGPAFGYEETSLVIELGLVDLLLTEETGPLEQFRWIAGFLLKPAASERVRQVPSRWLLMILSDQLADPADSAATEAAAIRLGEFAAGFADLSQQLRDELPLAGTADPEALFAAARKAGTLLLGENLFLARQDAIFAPDARLDLAGFPSRSDLYAAMFAAMTPQGRELSVKQALSAAEHALLDPAAYEASAEMFRMIVELLQKNPQAFDNAPVFEARAHLQIAYLDTAAGQIMPAAMEIAGAENSLAGAPESREKTFALALVHRTRGLSALLVGDVNGGAKDLETAASLLDEVAEPSLSTWAHLSQAYAMGGDFARAIATAEAALARLPHLRTIYDTSNDEALLHMAMADAYGRSERLAEMKDGLNQALRLPLATAMSDQLKFRLTGYHFAAGGGCRDALPLLEELAAGEGFPRSDFEQDVRISLARCYSERAEPERARPHLERAAELNRYLRRARWVSPYYRTSYASPSLPELERLVRTTFFDLMERSGPDRGELARQLLYETEILRSRQLVDEIEANRGLIFFASTGTSRQAIEKAQADAMGGGVAGMFPVVMVGGPVAEQPAAATVQKLQALTATLSKRHGRPTVLLEYVPIPERDRLVLYVIQETSLDALVLDARWSEVEEGIDRLRHYIALTLDKYTKLRSSPQPEPWLVQRIARLEKEIDLLGQSLGTALLPMMPGNRGSSLAGLLRGKSVVIVPHGALHALPFPALRIGSEYLLDLVGRFSVAPSALSLDALLSHYTFNLASKVEDLLLVGDRANPGLPFVAAELDALAALTGNPRVVADEATVKESFPQASAVHFSSHAFYDPQDPSSSGLLLGRDVLTIEEITSQMKTRKTRLVTLGACESSLAEASQVGDDVWSLATGFLYTGAPAVVASLWLQDGASSLVFYRSFYRSVVAGEEIGTAFRHAVLEVRAQAHGEKLAGGALRGLDSPAFWAGFTFLGE